MWKTYPKRQSLEKEEKGKMKQEGRTSNKTLIILSLLYYLYCNKLSISFVSLLLNRKSVSVATNETKDQQIRLTIDDALCYRFWLSGELRWKSLIVMLKPWKMFFFLLP
jgi:hypothetical protein